jgi:hypothetical protein
VAEASAAAAAAAAAVHSSASQPKGFVMKRVNTSPPLLPQQSNGMLVDSDQGEKGTGGLLEPIGDETDAEELSPLCIR